MNKLIDYRGDKKLLNKEGSYLIYVEKNNEKYVYSGISIDVRKRFSQHLSNIRNVVKTEDFEFAILTNNLLFRKAFYQKLLMFLIKNNINFDEIKYSFSYSGNNINQEFQNIKKYKIDYKGFNGISFHSVLYAESLKNENMEEYINHNKIIEEQKEYVLNNYLDILPHSFWSIKTLGWFTKKKENDLYKLWENYCLEVNESFNDWINENNKKIWFGNSKKITPL